ncbi:hypothetical protein [Leclercia sp.]|uniref:hypothetical protein n=1 Tax=Leclercia sp. TaxID=1898428 RepID=UPI0028BD2AF1|nr:hypothetical protein [Leclercia sp.]
MKIECILHRPGGSLVQLEAPRVEYHFKPSDADPRHIAEVADSSHISTLLRITEGYRSAETEQKEEKPRAQVTLTASALHNPIYNIPGGTIVLADVVEMAQKDSGLSPEDWNDLDDQDRTEWIDQVLLELQATVPAAPTEIAGTPAAKSDEESEESAETPADDGQAGDDNAANGPDQIDTEDELETLRAEYKKVFKRNPAKSMTAANLKRAISEA